MTARLVMATTHFAAGVNSVLACAATDRTSPTLCAINIAWADGLVVFSATDRYVLGEQTIRHLPEDVEASEPSGSALVPTDTVKAVLAMVKASKQPTVAIEGAAAPYEEGKLAGLPFAGLDAWPKVASLFPHESLLGGIERVGINPGKLVQLAGPKFRGKYPDLRLNFQKDGPAKGVLVTRIVDEDRAFRGLIMPIRLPS